MPDALRADGRFNPVYSSRVLGDEAEHLLLALLNSRGIVVPVMYKQRKAANVLNDRYPMAYKS